MNVALPLSVLYILHRLKSAGYDAYVVGGAVRDLLLVDMSEGNLQRKVTDYDFTTNAKPEEIQALFPQSFYENKFGTVSVTAENIAHELGLPVHSEVSTRSPDSTKVIDPSSATKLHESLSAPTFEDNHQSEVLAYPDYQITTYRSDEVYDDFRRPTSMTWGTSLKQDLERRDFTINSLALSVSLTDLSSALNTKSGSANSSIDVPVTIEDPFAGLNDLQLGIVQAVGNPQIRFQEDALRMLRAIRFAVQLNFQIADPTFEAILDNSTLLKHISGERIRDEFVKIIASNYPAEGVELLDEAGLLPYILPELEATKGVKQAGHHTTDVWTHSLDALRFCPSADPIVRLATLLHDIAKPLTQKFTAKTITFYNHEIIGARVAKKIAERLKLPRKDVQRIFTLVRHHMFYYQPTHTDAAIRRFMRNVGLENIDDILALREGDRLGSGARSTSWRLEEMKQRMQAQLHQPMSIKDLAINGDLLMSELQLPPGPKIGQILKKLFELVANNPELNTTDKLLAEARKTLAD